MLLCPCSIRRVCRLVFATTILLLAPALLPVIGAQTLESERNRLIENWAGHNGFGNNVCAGWNTLSESAKWVFVWNTHRLSITGLLPDVTELYSIAGGAGASCGGLENNRTFMAMTPQLQQRLRQTAAGNGTIVPGWRSTRDPACVTGIGECPHVPFTRQVETIHSGPTGQIQFFPNPDILSVRRVYREYDLSLNGGVPYICKDDSFETVRATPLCTTGTCTEPQADECSVGRYTDHVDADPRAEYFRGAVGRSLQDPYSFEMDQDINFAHDSNPMCGATQYQNNWGSPGWGWAPAACGPPPCTWSWGSTIRSYGAGAASDAVGVTTHCAWTITSDVPWVTITSPSSGANDGTVTFSLDANPEFQSRTGTLFINGSIPLQITQAGFVCSQSVSPASLNVGDGSASGMTTVLSNCAWTANTTTPSWLTITSGASGNGTGSIRINAAPNASSIGRWGDVIVRTATGVATLRVNQAGRPCNLSLTSGTTSFGYGGGAGSVTVTAAVGDCTWNVNSTVSWITTAAGASGSGNGVLTFVVGPNASASSRAGTISGGGSTITVLQGGRVSRTSNDYDGDGRTDAIVFRPSTGQWLGVLATGVPAPTIGWGVPGDVPVPADYDGDRRTDVAVFRPSTGTWFAIYSSTGASVSLSWGASADVPVPADYDGDGRADPAVFRRSTGQWWIYRSTGGVPLVIQHGTNTDIPVPADYDGDGRADVAFFRPSSGLWSGISSSGGATSTLYWGGPGDIPAPGDADADGRADVVIFRPSTGQWLGILSTTGAGTSFGWGMNGDMPLIGDYDGDRKQDLVVFRPSNATWYAVFSGTMSGVAFPFGLPSDIPVNRAPRP